MTEARRPRVAFVDDNAEMRGLALELFSRHGFDTFVLERESAEVERILRWQPDVIVLDPHGHEYAARRPFALALELVADSRAASIPVVLIAEPWTLWQYESEVRATKPAATLPKPFDVGELLETLDQLIGTR